MSACKCGDELPSRSPEDSSGQDALGAGAWVGGKRYSKKHSSMFKAHVAAEKALQVSIEKAKAILAASVVGEPKFLPDPTLSVELVAS